MRILRIAGRNLASLAGDFEVDFQAAPLAGAGLFAISGPTGAGKSTLLDALCLALYDATPRLLKTNAARLPDVGDETVSIQDPRTLLRRGVAEGFAEVDFEAADQHRYRARWSVRRSRNKAGGALQRADMTLHSLPTLAPIGRTNKEVLAEIAQRLGLNFEQFTRSVLLAQNEFSAFLKTEENERGELLETLTGSSVYSSLSRRAYARYRDEQERLKLVTARLADQVPMPDSERAAIEATSQATTEALAQLEPAKAALESRLRWFEEERLLRDALTAAHAAAELASASHVQARPRRELLEAIDKVQAARPLVAEQERLAREQSRLAAMLDAAKHGLADSRQKAAEAGARADAATAALDAATAAVRQAQPALDQAKAHDARLAALATPLDSVRRRHAALTGELAQASAQLGESALLAATEAEAACVRAGAQHQAAQAARNAAAATLQAHDIAGMQAARAALEARTADLQQARERWQAMQAAGAALAAAQQAAGQWQAEIDRLEQDLANAGASLPALEAASVQAQRSLSLARLACAGDVESLRSQLQDGHPCPVCGSAEHPYSGKDPALHALLAQLEGEAALATDRLEGARAQVTTLRERRAGACKQADAHAAALARLDQAHRTALVAWQAEPASQAAQGGHAGDGSGPPGELPVWFTQAAHALDADAAALSTRESALREALSKREVAQQLLDAAAVARDRAASLAAAVANRDRIQLARANAHSELSALVEATEALRAQRAMLFEGGAVEDVERALAHQLEEAAAQHASAQAAAGAAASGAALAQAALQQADVAFSANTTALASAQAGVADWLAGQPGLDGTALAALLAHSVEQVRDERIALAAIGQAVAGATAVLAERRGRHDAHLAAATPGPDAAETGAALAALAAERDAAMAHAGRLRAALAQDDARRQSAAALRTELERQQNEEQRWARMNELIGSADGKKFRNYAQQFTLDVLLGYANAHLHHLARRYRLERVASASGPSLGLMVRDQDMGGEIRSVNSLSGGESFLVSLALALGLASLSSNRVKVESLFIDEGFGSLDSDTLRIAMDALDGLQATGRRVGIISHVQEMTERIAVRILVQPSGGGSSTVAVA